MELLVTRENMLDCRHQLWSGVYAPESGVRNRYSSLVGNCLILRPKRQGQANTPRKGDSPRKLELRQDHHHRSI
jgi:hypothetical protein